MLDNKFARMLFVIGITLLLTACLGEAELPSLEETSLPTILAPAADPTIAAFPRINIRFDDVQQIANQQIPQIPHDMIGRSDCLMCHKQGINEAPRVTDSHRGLNNNSCQGCHTAPVSAELSGKEMYARVCARCHGERGEGGYGPALNNKTYLSSVNDQQLQEAISRGRGAPQMLAWGDLGLLTERQINELVSLIRSWESDAPEVAEDTVAETPNSQRGDAKAGELLFAQYCAGCHGLHAESEVGDGIILGQVVSKMDDASLSQIIRDGDQDMPSFHALLITEDISNLLAFLREISPDIGEATIGEASFSKGVLPIFEARCTMCHGTSGGWSATTYLEATQSGDNAPNIISGDPDASPLVKRLRGTQETGGRMPPGGELPEGEIEQIESWIAAGAKDN